MKQKISITLSTDVLEEVDRVAGAEESRSAFIERVLRSYLRRRERADADLLELERLNRAAEVLNEEVAEVLAYQTPWDE